MHFSDRLTANPDISLVEELHPVTSEMKVELDTALVKMIAQDIQPISIVEDKGFAKFCQILNSNYVLPSRRTLSKVLLPALFNDVQEKLSRKLEGVNWLSITTDLWTSINTSCYLAVTIHFWDEESSIPQSFILDCLRIGGRHTAQRLGEELRQILIEHGVMSKVVVGVTDNGANIVRALREINISQVPCYAHTLNLVAQGSIKDVPTLVKVKDVVSRIVEQTRRSTVVLDKFESIQKNQGHKIKKLIQDVSTRWNSTYEMMERILELKGPIAELLTEPGMSAKIGVVDSSTWQVLGEAVDVLQPLYEGTKELSGEKITTGSKAIPLTKMLMMRYTFIIEHCQPGTVKSQLATAIFFNLRRRFGELEEIKELALATLLDPRFKTNGFQSTANKERALANIHSELESTYLIEEQEDKDKPQVTPHSRSCLWEPFDSMVSQHGKNAMDSAKQDIHTFLSLPCQPRSSDPLHWWKGLGKDKFPLLFQLAQKYLCIPATSVPSERVFSMAGQIISKKRNRLGDECARKLIILNHNLKQ